MKNGYGFVGGLSASKLRRTRISLVVLRRRLGGSAQVEVVTTDVALMEQITPRVETASLTCVPFGSCGFCGWAEGPFSVSFCPSSFGLVADFCCNRASAGLLAWSI